MKTVFIKFLYQSIRWCEGRVITASVHERWYNTNLSERSVLFLTPEQKKHLRVHQSLEGINLDEIGEGWFYPARSGPVATLPPRIEIMMCNPRKWHRALELICSVFDFPVEPNETVLQIRCFAPKDGELTFFLVGEPPQS